MMSSREIIPASRHCLPRDGGRQALLEALKLRHSTRAYSDRSLSPQNLSDLLWSAFGINRPASGDPALLLIGAT